MERDRELHVLGAGWLGWFPGQCKCGGYLVFRTSQPRAIDCRSALAVIWFLVRTSCAGCTLFLYL